MRAIPYSLLVAMLLSLAVVAGEDEVDELDDLALMFDLESMDTAAARKLADKLIKDPENLDAGTAVGLIAHPKLNDAKRATRLYDLVKDKVGPDDYELLADSALLGEASSDPVLASLVIRLIGLTRNPEAKETLMTAFRKGDPAFRAAAAHAIGYFGDLSLLPRLQEEYAKLGQPPRNKQYADGLVRGMLLLADFDHFPGLVAEQARVSGGIVGCVMQIASHFSSPHSKRLASKRLVGFRQQHARLQKDIVEIAPRFPAELARYVVDLVEPNQCDVLYRLLPQLMTDEHYAAYIPALRAKCMDLRQFVLDRLTDGLVKPSDLSEIRRIILEWYGDADPMGRLWAIRNCGVLEAEPRRKLLLKALASDDRWERVAAILEIQRAPEEPLIQSARALANTTDPDTRLHLNRLLLRFSPLP